MSLFRRAYSSRTPLPTGYAVEWWPEDEMFHWVLESNPHDTYSDGTVRHWDCWHGAWAHHRANTPTPAGQTGRDPSPQRTNVTNPGMPPNPFPTIQQGGGEDG